MTPHRGSSRQRHCRDGPVAAADGPRRGHSRYPVRLPSDCRRTCPPVTGSLRPTAPAWWPPAHVVRSPPARVPRSWCRSRGMVALLPLDLPTTSPAAAPGCDPEADACVVGAGAPLHHLDTARPAGRHPGRLADLPFGLAARHPPATPRYPRHVARAMPARVRQAILARGSRPSRTAQPPLRASMVGRELPLRKDDRGGTTAGTTGIASSFLTRIRTAQSRPEIASAFEHLMHQFPHSTRVTMAPTLTGQTAMSGRPSRFHRPDAWPEGAGQPSFPSASRPPAPHAAHRAPLPRHLSPSALWQTWRNARHLRR